MTVNSPLFPRPWSPGLNTEHPLAKGLVALYPCWEAGAVGLSDLTHRGFASPTTGALNWTQTSYGPAVGAVDATAFQFKLPSFVGTAVKDHAYSIFVIPSGTVQVQYILEYTTQTAKIACYYTNIGGSTNIVFLVESTTITVTITPNQLHHLALSVRNGKAYPFIDGVYVGSFVNISHTVSDPFYFLSRSSVTNESFAGGATGLMFWNRGLSNAEIGELTRDPWAVHRQPDFSIPFMAPVFTETGSGGAIVSGVASSGHSFNFTGSGGAIASGSTTSIAQFNPSVGGGALAGGSAIANKPSTFTASGGAVVSGNAVPGGTNDFGASGGVKVGGASAPSYIFNPVLSSGALAGGSAKTAGTYATTASGGAIVSGTVIVTNNPTASGGVVISGQAALTMSWNMVAAGGTIVSGGTGQSISQQGSGGALISGAATTQYQFQNAASGGAIVGGHVPEVKNASMSGGVRCLGIALLDFIYRNHIEQDQVNIVYSGGINNSDPTKSLGGTASVIGIPNKLDNLFADSTPAEVTYGSTEYRAFYVFNDNEIGTMYNTKVWIDISETVTAVAIAIGATDAVADSIGVQNNPPANITFSSPTAESDGLVVGTLRPLDGFYVWMRRTIVPGTPSATDDGVFFHLSATDSP